jgi:hypothetical protein
MIVRLADLKGKLKGAVVEACDKEGCGVHIDIDKGRVVVIDGDLFRQITNDEGKVSDCFIFVETAPVSLLIVECKSGNCDARRAFEQISRSALKIEPLLNRGKVEFRPTLLYGRVGHASEIKILKTRYVRFQGAKHLIRYSRCGSSLSALMS